MSVDVRAAEIIDRPVAVVAGFSAEPSNAPRWRRRVTSITWQTAPPLGLGSQVTVRARFLWRRIAFTFVVSEDRPRERLTMHTAEGRVPFTTTFTWETVNVDATLMTITAHVAPTGLWRFAAPLISMSMRRTMTLDLRQLKRLVESLPAE